MKTAAGKKYYGPEKNLKWSRNRLDMALKWTKNKPEMVLVLDFNLNLKWA